MPARPPFASSPLSLRGLIGYADIRAVAVVEARVFHLFCRTEFAAMIVIAIALSATALGALVLLILNAATLALPVFVAATVLVAALHRGVSPVDACLLALSAGVATLLTGRAAMAAKVPSVVRLGLVSIFVIPAGWAGYGIGHGIMSLAGASSGSAMLVGTAGAILSAGAAFVRLVPVPADPSHSPTMSSSQGR